MDRRPEARLAGRLRMDQRPAVRPPAARTQPALPLAAEPTRLPEGRPVLAPELLGVEHILAALAEPERILAVQPAATHRRFMAVQRRGEATNTPPSPAARCAPAPTAG